MKRLILITVILLLSSSIALAQEPCTADFGCNGNVDANDVTTFLSQFGRNPFNDPCPDCYDSPCPCSSTSSCIEKIPKTGQSTSYATGDDGDLEKGLEWPNPRFTDNGNGTVTDNLTLLIWLKDANCYGARTWNGALSECNGLASGSCGLTDDSLAGDWRLPNISELYIMVDHERQSPSLPLGYEAFFNNVQSASYWSSTTNVRFQNYAKIVGLLDGVANHRDKTLPLYFWPVRGGWVRFTDNGNGTVTDNNTGLLWLKDANCFGYMDWYDAMDSSADLANGQCGLTDGSSVGDWKLPTREEWQAFFCKQYTHPALCNTEGTEQWVEGDSFNHVQDYVYWSSTTFSLDSTAAWIVSMSDGDEGFIPGNKTDRSYHVWPVRSDN